MKGSCLTAGLALLVIAACSSAPKTPEEIPAEACRDGQVAGTAGCRDCRDDAECGEQVCADGRCVACRSDDHCTDASCVFNTCLSPACAGFEPVPMVTGDVAVTDEAAESRWEQTLTCLDGLDTGTLTLEVDCSSDGEGDEAAQVALSTRRAAAFREAATSRGIPSDLIVVAPTDRFLPASDSHCRFAWKPTPGN